MMYGTAQDVRHRASAARTFATHQQANVLVRVVGERIGGEHVMQAINAGLDRRAIRDDVANIGIDADVVQRGPSR